MGLGFQLNEWVSIKRHEVDEGNPLPRTPSPNRMMPSHIDKASRYDDPHIQTSIRQKRDKK
jgi:hypothetical protein